MEVSVIVPVYNQEKFISKCLDSIFSQKTTFSFEVLVGDDCSTDNTLQILLDYSQRFDNVKIHSREQNIGATKNVYDLCTKMRGRYFAYLEGDDYWCDENKLQQQYDFMRNNPEYAGCFHDVQLVDIEGNPIDNELEWVTKSKIITMKSYDGHHLPGHPSSWMRRNYYLENPDDFSPIYELNKNIGDRVAALCFLAKGPFYNIGGRMSCYRYMRDNLLDNCTSKIYFKNNLALDDINMLEGMEKFLSEKANYKKKFNSRKNQIFVDALVRYCRDKSDENKNILKEVYQKCENHFLLILRTPFLVMKKVLHRYLIKKAQ